MAGVKSIEIRIGKLPAGTKKRHESRKKRINAIMQEGRSDFKRNVKGK